MGTDFLLYILVNHKDKIYWVSQLNSNIHSSSLATISCSSHNTFQLSTLKNRQPCEVIVTKACITIKNLKLILHAWSFFLFSNWELNTYNIFPSVIQPTEIRFACLYILLNQNAICLPSPTLDILWAWQQLLSEAVSHPLILWCFPISHLDSHEQCLCRERVFSLFSKTWERANILQFLELPISSKIRIYLHNVSARVRISADSKGGSKGFWLKNEVQDTSKFSLQYYTEQPKKNLRYLAILEVPKQIGL